MRRVLLALAAAGLLAGASACGATDERETSTSFTGSQVAREFDQATGRPLRRTAGVPDPAWQQLSYGLNPSTELVRRYGIFSVYVVEAENEEALTSLLSDKATGKPLERDERGVYWERDSQSGTWTAYSRYGGNVVLVWFSERTERETDERWARLDRILSGLES